MHSLFEFATGKKREFRDAAETGNLAKVMTLFQEGQDIDSASDYGATALHKASARGQLAMVQFLVSQGANLQAVHKGGRTAQQEAELQGHADVADVLRKATKKDNLYEPSFQDFVEEPSVNGNALQDEEPSLLEGFKEFVVDPGAEVVGDFVTGRKYSLLEVLLH
jgi:ankyrin repeat protein